MIVKILRTTGYNEALYGLGLSHGLTTSMGYIDFIYAERLYERVEKVAKKLASKSDGHNKFLESIKIWLEIHATRYFWSEADTYRLSTKQSESTMHKQELRFQEYKPNNPAEAEFILELEGLQKKSEELYKKGLSLGNIELAKAAIVESLIQKRIWCFDYKTLRNIIAQRRNHKLECWQVFCDYLLENARFKWLLEDAPPTVP